MQITLPLHPDVIFIDLMVMENLIAQIKRVNYSIRNWNKLTVTSNRTVLSSRGLYNGGSIPLGFKNCHSRSGSLEIDEPHAATVRVAFDAFLREGCLSRAARWLNDNGHKAKAHLEGGGSRMRIGHFTVGNLQKMLRNKAYIGVKSYRHKGEDINLSERLVTIETFEEFNEIEVQSLKIYWNLEQENFDSELKIKKPGL